MKRLLLCLLLVFMLGCVPLEEVAEEPSEFEEIPEEQVKEPVKEKPVEKEYLLNVGDIINVAGKRIEIRELNFENELTVVVDGIKKVISLTRVPEIINGLEITAKEISFDPEGKGSNALLEIAEFELGENEYLMYIGDEVVVDYKKIILKDVYTDDLNSIRVRISVDEKRINKGETVTMGRLVITNVKTNPRAITAEKYAILRIKEVKI